MAETPGTRTWDPTRIAAVVVVVLLAVALAGGAAVVGAPDRTAVDDPAGYVLSFYQESDVAGLLGALAPGSIPGEQRAQAEQDLQRLLQPQVEVTGTREHALDGAIITEVTTSDGLTWCVDGDGTLYVRCRIGSAPVEVQAGDVPLESPVAQLDVFPDHVELVLGLATTGDETVGFSEAIELRTDADATPQLIQSAVASGGQLSPVQLADFELTSDLTLFLVWRATREAVADQTVTLAWEGGSVDVRVGEVDELS